MKKFLLIFILAIISASCSSSVMNPDNNTETTNPSEPINPPEIVPQPILDAEAMKYGIDISQDDNIIKEQIATKMQEYKKDKGQYKVIFIGKPKAEYTQKSSLAKLVLDAAYQLSIYYKNVEIDISKIYFDERKIKSSMFKGFPSYADCTITFTFPENSITVIEGNAFSLFGKHFKEIAIPDSVIGIKAYAFQVDNSLSKVTFGVNSKLEYIEDLAFSYCPINEIVIPASVTSIGANPFGNSLTKVTYLGTKPNTIKNNRNVFSSYDSIQTLSVPNAEDITDPAWKTFLGGNFQNITK